MDAHVRDLRYFVAVAEELSFTRAARDRLFVSQPALSKQIRHLEESLRVTLFDRDRRTVALTAEGQALLPHARRVIEQWHTAQRAVADAAATQGRTLTIGFQTRIGRGIVPSVTERMHERLPGWRPLFRQVSWADPTVGLAGGEVDIAVAWLPLPPGGHLASRVVATEERWVALPPGHRLTGHDIVAFAELAEEPFVALPARAGVARDFWLARSERESPAIVSAEAETAEEVFEAVAAGLGVSLMAAGNAEIYLRDDVAWRPVSGLAPCELAVVWRRGDDRGAVRIAVDACARCLCELP